MLWLIVRDMTKNTDTLFETVILRLLAETSLQDDALIALDESTNSDAFRKVFGLYVEKLINFYNADPSRYFDLGGDEDIDIVGRADEFNEAVKEDVRINALSKILRAIVDKKTSSIDNEGILLAFDSTMEGLAQSLIIGAYYSEIPPDETESLEDFMKERIEFLKKSVSDNYALPYQLNWVADPALIEQVPMGQED